MAVAIPIIAAFGAGTAVATGMVTGLAAFATVAGAALSVVGAVTKDQDLARLGAVLSLGAGIAGMANAAGGAAEAASAADAATQTAQSGFRASEIAAQNAGAASTAGELAATQATNIGVDGTLGATGAAQTASGAQPQAMLNAPSDTSALSPTLSTADTSGGIMTQAMNGTNVQTPGLGEVATPAAAQAPSNSILQNAASRMDTNSLTSRLGTAGQAPTNAFQSVGSKIGDFANSVGTFAQKNPVLLQMGGQMLSSMYGPQAEMMDLRKSILERARTNLNSPVVMTYTPKG